MYTQIKEYVVYIAVCIHTMQLYMKENKSTFIHVYIYIYTCMHVECMCTYIYIYTSMYIYLALVFAFSLSLSLLLSAMLAPGTTSCCNEIRMMALVLFLPQRHKAPCYLEQAANPPSPKANEPEPSNFGFQQQYCRSPHSVFRPPATGVVEFGMRTAARSKPLIKGTLAAASYSEAIYIKEHEHEGSHSQGLYVRVLGWCHGA